MRSDSQPNGYCSTSAPAKSIAMNSEIRLADMPICVPKTAPIPDCVA